jgi:hypothetical protein
LFFRKQEVTFQCFNNGTWTTTTRELDGSSETYAEAPQFFVPEKVTVLRNQERDAIPEALPPERESLHFLKAKVTTSRHIDHLDRHFTNTRGKIGSIGSSRAAFRRCTTGDGNCKIRNT